MNSFFEKYRPKKFEDFIIDKDIVNIIKSLLEIDTLNILLIGNSGSGKTSLLRSIMYEYYKTDKLPTDDILYINNLQEQGVQYYRNELKTFCQILKVPKIVNYRNLQEAKLPFLMLYYVYLMSIKKDNKSEKEQRDF